MVLEHRILRPEPMTLEAVGQELEVTRERVRQIQLRVTNSLRDAVDSQITTIANLLREHLPPVLTDDELSRSAVRTFSKPRRRISRHKAGEPSVVGETRLLLCGRKLFSARKRFEW